MTVIPKLLLTLGCLLFIGCSTAREFTAANVVSAPPRLDLININTATADELTKLPGIGETLAQKIVDYREANGRFHRSEHLMLVDGISEKRFREIKPYISVE
jgi:competence protein ComEA